MSEGFQVTDDDLENGPPEAPEPVSEPRTRTTRRPARGRESTGGRTAQKSRAKKAAAPSPPEPTVADAIRGMLQLPAAGFIIAGQRIESTALVADGATILVHGPQVAQAIQEIAENDPRVMALLEKVLAFGPYGVLLAALLPMTAQFVRNHNEQSAPIVEGFGAVPPERIISAASLEVPTQVSPNGQGPADGSPTVPN